MPGIALIHRRTLLLRVALLTLALLALSQFLIYQTQSRARLELKDQCKEYRKEHFRPRDTDQRENLTRGQMDAGPPPNAEKQENVLPMPLYRDLFVQDAWPGVDLDVSTTLGHLSRTVYYLWCGDKQFLFQHYLVLLSALRVVKATKIIFMYSDLPQKDGNLYNTWFEEFKHSVPNFSLMRVIGTCGTKDPLKIVLGFLSTNGGVFLGENAVISHLPRGVEKSPFWFAFSGDGDKPDVRRGVVIAPHGFNKSKVNDYLHEVTSAKPACVRADRYDGPVDAVHCVIADSDVHPRDIWQEKTAFAELARWLYYGRRSLVVPVADPSRPIPRIAHCVWLTTDASPGDPNLTFAKFLSIISALYVGGFQHVYLYGNRQPGGEWWQRLLSENVTFVNIDRPDTMFQMDFPNLQANGDFLRAIVLLQYGGAYMDMDAVWTSRVPDMLLNYPAVASFDWPKSGSWPDTFNLGVLLARPQAPWLRHWLTTFRHYQLSSSGFTATLMPYRVLEHFPDQLYVDTHLQVICFFDICHPTWEKDFRRGLFDRTPTLAFKVTDAHAVHVTQPKPPESWESPTKLKEGKDFLAEIGRHILKESGRMQLLS